jgi:glucose-6-phosphate isomerase
MTKIKFDFNNMFDFNVGAEHGVSLKELSRMSKLISRADQHLRSLISHPVNRKNLGVEWVRLYQQDEKLIRYIQNLGREIAGKYRNVIFLGIGGSFLGLKAAQDALAPFYHNEFKSGPKIYFEGNNLDPDTLSVLLKNLKARETFVVVISKSGETIETKVSFEVVRDWLKKGLGSRFGRNIFAITDPTLGTLRKIVNEAQSKDKLSFRNLPLLPGVGGRYSEFNMGLLHLAIIGVNIREVLSGARQMFKTCQAISVWKNPAYLYAALHTILYTAKKKSIAVVMPFAEGLKATADWYVQLLAESLGKKFERKIEVGLAGVEKWYEDKRMPVNVGRTPIACRGTNDLHSVQQNNVQGENNKAVTFIRVEKFKSELKVPGEDRSFIAGKKFSELMKLAQTATEWALVRESRPNCTIVLPELSASTWGQLLFFFEMATAFEAELLNVNAFDQPGVEGYKNYLYHKLRKPGMPREVAQEIDKHPLVKRKKFIL